MRVYIHGCERKLGPFCDSHQSAVILCQKLFPALAHATEVGFYAIDLVKGEGCLEICAEIWRDVAFRTTKMVVVNQSSKLLEISKGFAPDCWKGLDIKTMTGKTLSIKGVFGVPEIKEQIQLWDGTPAHLQQITCNGVELADKICLSRVDYHQKS